MGSRTKKAALLALAALLNVGRARADALTATTAKAALDATGVSSRQVPLGAALAILGAPVCFEVTRGPVGAIDGSGVFRGVCDYFLMPAALIGYAIAPLLPYEASTPTPGEEPPPPRPTVHALDVSAYLLDFRTKSALTGAPAREPVGGPFSNLGYDFAYTYTHPQNGLVGYAHATWQQTSLATSKYLIVSNEFLKLDAQIGFDLVRFLTGGDSTNPLEKHAASVRIGPSLFHDWIYSRDVGNPKEGANVENPLNNAVPLVTGLGYEVAAELRYELPHVLDVSLGSFRFDFERGVYPSIRFPAIDPRDAAFVAMIGFEDLRKGSSFAWQRMKLAYEPPFGFSRAGTILFGGQLASFANDDGSGVDNRGFSIDYSFRYE
jgi:hypothetical protein